MLTKEQAISRAQKAGSKAETLAGAVRFLMTRLDTSKTPLYQRGTKVPRILFSRRDHTYQHRALRIAAGLGIWAKDDAETLAAKLDAALLARVAASLMKHWPYRRSTSGWVGGEHTVTVKIGDPAVTSGSTTVWHGKHTWSGTNSYAHLTVTREALGWAPTLLAFDVVVLDLLEVAPFQFRAAWLEQSRGSSVRPVDGWIINGYKSKAGTLAIAQREAAKYFKNQVKARLLGKESA